jgi:hypothetical protein
LKIQSIVTESRSGAAWYEFGKPLGGLITKGCEENCGDGKVHIWIHVDVSKVSLLFKWG